MMEYLVCFFFSNNNNNNYKYALDILHFIVHQQCAKDEKYLHQLTTKRERELFSITADLQMEQVLSIHSKQTLG